MVKQKPLCYFKKSKGTDLSRFQTCNICLQWSYKSKPGYTRAWFPIIKINLIRFLSTFFSSNFLTVTSNSRLDFIRNTDVSYKGNISKLTLLQITGGLQYDYS